MEDRRDIVKRRISRFFGLLAVAALVTGMVIINQRLSQDTLALLVGLTFGIGAMLPTVGIGVYMLRREDKRRKERDQRSQGHATQPPVIVVTPQQLPNQGYSYNHAYNQQPPILVDEQNRDNWGPSRRSGRDFQMVGSGD